MGDWSDFEETMADRDGEVFGDEHLYDGEPDEAERAAAFDVHMGVMEEGNARIGDEVRQRRDAPGAPILAGGPPLLTEQQRYERVDGEWMRWHLPGSRWVRVPMEDLGFIEVIEATRREMASLRKHAEWTARTADERIAGLRAQLREAVTVLDEIGDTQRYDDSGPASFYEAIHRVQWLARRLRTPEAT